MSNLIRRVRGYTVDNLGGGTNLHIALRFIALLSAITAMTLSPMDSKSTTIFLL